MVYSIVWPCQLFCSVWICLFRGCLIDVCNCDVFSVVHLYLNHLKFCIVCINGRRYVFCSECNVVSDECDEPTPCLVQPVGAHGGEVMYFCGGCVRGELGFLNCNNMLIVVVYQLP